MLQGVLCARKGSGKPADAGKADGALATPAWAPPLDATSAATAAAAAEDARGKPERRALVIGIDYTRSGGGLRGCAAKAVEMAARLEAAGYACVKLLDGAADPEVAKATGSGGEAAEAAEAATQPEARRILKELMALAEWARAGRGRQCWIHYVGIGVNHAEVLGADSRVSVDDSGLAMVPPGRSKRPSWRGHSWPPRAHPSASEGLGLPTALVRRVRASQIPPRGRGPPARARPSRRFHRV